MISNNQSTPEEQENQNITPIDEGIQSQDQGEVTPIGEGEGQEDSQEGEVTSIDDTEELGTGQLAEVAPSIIEDQYKRNLEKVKLDASMSRALSSANSWAQGISKFFTSDPLKSASLHSAWITNAFLEEDADPLEMPVYQAAENLGKTLEEIFPDNPLYRDEFWAGIMAKASGQFTGQIATMLATLGAGGSTGAVWTTNSLSNVGMSAQFYERAREGGASEDEAFANLLLNTTGSVALEGIAPTLMARRLNKATGGGLVKLAKNGFKGSMEEGFTEAIQGYYSNVIDKEIYDSTRDLMEGVVEGMAAGALLGGFANITLTGLSNRGVRAKTPEGVTQAKDAVEMVNREYADIDVEGTLEFIDSVQREGSLASKGIAVTRTGLGTPLTTKNHSDQTLWERGWRRFMSAAPQGEAMRNMSEYTSGVIKAQTNKALLLGNRVNEAILDYSNVDTKWFGKRNIAKAIENGDVDQTLITRVDGVLRGEVNESSIPKELRKPVKDMRTHIDQLSMDAMKADIAQGDLGVKFAKELGTYLHRTYKLYDPEIEWSVEDIDSKDWNKAVSHLRSQIKGSDQFSDNMTDQEITREAEGQLRQLLDKETSGSLKAIFMDNKSELVQDKGDKDVLMERQNIHPAIRKVMGEYTDPIHNYVTSVEKMANTFYKRLMFDQMAEQFKGQHFFTEQEVNQMENHSEFRNTLETGVDSDLDNMYMHDDMYAALTRTNDFSNHPAFLRAIYTMNSVAKYSKTVLSHVTVARNVVGGSWFLGFNGLLFNNPMDTFRKAREAGKLAFKSLPKLDEEGLAEKRLEYDRLNLTGQNVFANEFMDSINDGYFNLDDPIEGNYEYFLEGRKRKGLINKVKKKVRQGAQKASDFYKKGDNFIRILQYELEKSQLQQADPSITDQEVANIVKDTYQNYGRLNQTTKNLRLAPLAPFISFPAELVRTATNTAKRANLETNSDNSQMRKIGYKRFAGMVTTSITAIGAGAASQMMNNIDDEEDSAYRELMAPWDKNSALVYVGSDRDGHIKYINTSYTNPYSYISDPIFAAYKGEDDQTVLEGTAKGLSKLMEPLLSEELFFQAADEVLNNKKRDGSEVYNPEDTLGDKVQKQFLHLWEAVEPGTITSIQRFTSAVEDDDSSSKPSDEMLGLLGLRISNLDIRESFGFRIREFRQDIRDAKRVYNSVKFNEQATRSEKRRALERANTQYEEIFEDMKRVADASRKSGVNWNELQDIMKDSGLASRDIQAIRTGAFQPFER